MIEELVKLDCSVAESPIWSSQEQCLYWIDIGKQTVYRFSQGSIPVENVCTNLQLPFPFSAIFEGENHALYLVTHHGIVQLNFKTGQYKCIFKTTELADKHRFNDAKVDAHGRLWLGSMDMTLSSPTGNLYCLDKKLNLLKKDQHFTVSNGLAWSPNQDKFYFVETVSRTIYRYNFDNETGELSNKEVFFTFAETDGKPDGITVDKNGDVLVALWDGWAVNRISANGDKLATIELPVPRPTSLAFGGEHWELLFITTASYGLSIEVLSKNPYSGSLLGYTPPTAGIAANLFVPS